MSAARAGWRVTAADRAALLRKYRLLAGWRVARDDPAAGAATPAARADLRALAAQFPGALRELDVLGLPEIERRIARLTTSARPRRAQRQDAKGARGTPGTRADDATAAPGGPDARDDDAWISWIIAYHALMRAALATKRVLGRKTLAAAAVPELARAATAVAGTPIDETFVRAVARPPAGRLGVVVLRAVAVRFDVAPARIAVTLFPPRRPSPYLLDLDPT